MTKNVTKRDYFEAIIAAMETGSAGVIAPEAIVEFARKEIAALERKAAKAKENAAKKRAEGDELKDAVAAALTDEPQLIAEITQAVAEVIPEASVAKVSYRLRKLVEDGVAEKSTKSIGEPGKKRTLVAYKVLDTVEPNEAA